MTKTPPKGFESVVGPFTQQRYTAAWVDLASSPGGGCWTYRDERQYGPSLGYADNRHPTAEKALEAAIARDVHAAAEGGPLSRAEYEAEVARLGLAIWDDPSCARMIGGDWDYPTYGIQGAAARTLAVRRGHAIRAERAASLRLSSPEDVARFDRELEAVDLEAQALDAEDRDQLPRASSLRAKARALLGG